MKKCLLVLSLSVPCLAAVPLRWTVETSRLQPAAFDAYRGETLALEASFNDHGKPLEIAGEAALYYQTNGMGAAWWSAPATVSSNRIAAAFTPAMDPGAQLVKCFLGGTASTYRAAFTLRFAASPGATPNVLPPPTVRSAEEDPVFAAWLAANPVPGTVSNIVTRAFVEFLGVQGGGVAEETDPTVPEWAKRPNPPEAASTNDVVAIGDGRWLRKDGGSVIGPVSFEDSTSFGFGMIFMNTQGKLQIMDWDKLVIETGGGQTLPQYLASGDWNTAGDPFARNSELPSTPEDVGAAPASLADTVNAWQTYWDGDDVRVIVTNYFGTQDFPRLYLEQKISEGGTNYFKTVWDEATRLAPITAAVASIQTNLADKADRAWGFCDSHTGAWAPEGFTSISSPGVIVSAGMSYQRAITAGGCSLWVLRANEPLSLGGVETNGFFRIEDADGNPVVEIVKGDKRTVGATATQLDTSGGVMHIVYATAGDHPTLKLSASLDAPNWIDETEAASLASVSWAGSSGEWHATVAPVAGLNSLFVRATYEVGGETYVKNSVPIGFDRVKIGAAYYRVTVETVNGRKLMVLTDE